MCHLLPGRLLWEDEQGDEESAVMPRMVIFSRKGPGPEATRFDPFRRWAPLLKGTAALSAKRTQR